MNTLHVKRQRGFTIVELMVAVAVGLIIIAGVGQVFVSNKHAYRYIEGVSTLQEQANYALDFIGSQAAAAGYIRNSFNFGTYANNKITMESQAYGGSLPLDGTEGGTDSDSLIINTYRSGNELRDCTGSVKPVDFIGPAGSGIQNKIEINDGASGRPALFCNGVEIVEGVENMQVLYGRSTINAAGQRVIQYFSRDELTTAEELSEVINVRIALLVSTPQETRAGENPDNTYELLGTTVTAPSDRRMRQVFTTTIRLRNRCQALPPTSGATICA